MKKLSQKEILILLLCVLIGFALRFYTFDKKSLWMDEIHTYNDSRDDFRNQMKFYKNNPTFLHPPFFFILTHQFYPFDKPERDLRIIPLIFGTLSIPMMFFLARSFSPGIALPCTLSLTFMTYHVSLSQDGRSYAILMFLGMASLYFFMRHLRSLKKRYLVLVALLFAVSFHASYSSIPFLVLSQLMWFYQVREDRLSSRLPSFFFLNGLILLFCLPWIAFVLLNYRGEVIMDPFHTESVGSFWYLLYGVFSDWTLRFPLMVISLTLLGSFPFFSKCKKNSIVLLSVFILPIVSLYLYCKLLDVRHFITSRYFIAFLPLFIVALYLSLNTIQTKLIWFEKYLRLGPLFLILFIASNLAILPFYYRSEKQDIRGLTYYLKNHLQQGDKIFVENAAQIPGILHYLGVHPAERHHRVQVLKDGEKEIGIQKPFIYQNKIVVLYHSKVCCTQYVADGSRLWIVASKWGAKKIKEESPCVFKGYFDGSFLNFNRFPEEAPMYLFLWDPHSQGEKGIDMPIEQ